MKGRKAIRDEAIEAADLIYNGQAVLRMCAAVLDPDNDLAEFDRHTIWRAMQVTDRILDQAVTMVDEIGTSTA